MVSDLFNVVSGSLENLIWLFLLRTGPLGSDDGASRDDATQGKRIISRQFELLIKKFVSTTQNPQLSLLCFADSIRRPLLERFL